MIINTTLSSSTYLFVPTIAAGPFICARHLIHHQLHLLLPFLPSTSPWMRRASCMSFGMIVTYAFHDCTLIGVFKETNKVCFQSLLEGKKGCDLHLQTRLETDSNLTDKTLEGCFPDQKFGAFLVFTNLAKGNGPMAVTMGLLHATPPLCFHLCSLCCKHHKPVQGWY